MEIKDKIADLLRFEGIECKGFGILPKFVMQDQDISIGAKALYAYYCSLAGAEYVTFPRRETILKQLKINKETFYKIQKELCAQGYIKVTQERTAKMNFSRNIYTLAQSPTKFIEHLKNQASLQSEHNKYDTAYMQGLKSTGYGIIPRIVMQDPRLELKAKAIYAYYVVYTGAGKLSHIKRDIILHHLGISKNTYNKYMQVLVQLNYITVQQCIDPNGRFCSNSYVLNNNPQSDTDTDKEEPCTKIPDTGEEKPCTKIPDTGEEKPCTKFPDTDKSLIAKGEEPCTKIPDTGEEEPCTKFPDPVKPDTNNIIIYNTRSLINQSINIAIQQEEENTVDRWIDDWECGIVFNPSHETVVALPEGILLSEGEATQIIHTLTQYAHYTAHPYDSALSQSTYELFNDALIELCSTPYERKLRGSVVTYISVIRKINKLIAGKDYLEASMTFDSFMGITLHDYINALKTTKISDNFKYMQSCIWSVLLTGEVRFHTMLLGAIDQP